MSLIDPATRPISPVAVPQLAIDGKELREDRRTLQALDGLFGVSLELHIVGNFPLFY